MQVSFEYDDVMHHTTRKCVSSVSDAIVFPSLESKSCHKYTENFENGDFFSVFKKRQKRSIVFARPHQNAKTPEVR